jgi:pimeloyl-ACP methyl ester carboxylesterase
MEFVNTLKTGPYIICGISLGANIIAEMIPFGIDPMGIFLAGSCLVGEGMGFDKIIIPGADMSVLSSDGPEDKDIKKYRNITSLSGDIDDEKQFLDQFKKVQAPFRSVFMHQTMNGRIMDEIALVRNFTRPVCWVFGIDEKMIDPHYLDDIDVPKWRQKVFKVKGASHFVNIDKPEEFNQLLAEFSVDCISNS